MSHFIDHEPMPVPTDGKPVWDMVIEDMRERDQVGRQRYGTPLQTHNGRRALVDAYQECLDLVAYMRQEIEERKALEQHAETMAGELHALRQENATLRNDVCGLMAREFVSLHEEIASYRDVLSRMNGLLAIVHRDGGHHAEEHGVVESAQAAGRKVAAVYQAAEALLPTLRCRFDGTWGEGLVDALEAALRVEP